MDLLRTRRPSVLRRRDGLSAGRADQGGADRAIDPTTPATPTRRRRPSPPTSPASPRTDGLGSRSRSGDHLQRRRCRAHRPASGHDGPRRSGDRDAAGLPPVLLLVPEAGCEVLEVPLAGGRELDLDGSPRRSPRVPGRCSSATRTTRPGRRRRAELEALAASRPSTRRGSSPMRSTPPMTLPGAEHVPFIGVSANAASRGIVLVSASKAFNLAGLGCAQIVTAAGPALTAAGTFPSGPPLQPLRCDRDRGRLRRRRRVARRRSSRSSTTTGRCSDRCSPSSCPMPATSPPEAGYLTLDRPAAPRPRPDPAGRDPRARPGRVQLRRRCSGRGTGTFASTPAPRPTRAEAVERIAGVAMPSAASMEPIDRALAPWWEPIRDCSASRPLRRPHAYRPERPRRLPAGVDELLDALEPVGARAVTFPMHEPDGYGPANDAVLAAVAAAPGSARRVRPRRPARRRARRGDPLPRPAGRGGSSCIPAPRASRSTSRPSRTCSRSPTNAACRSSSTPAAGSRRSARTR